MEDEFGAVIELAQHGDKQAFSTLVDAYNLNVYNLCYRMLENAGDAEDAAQETFIRAYRSIKRYDNKRKFITWLLSIAANYCIDQHRKRKLISFSLDDAPYIQIPDGKPGIEKGIMTAEENQRVHKLLESLGPQDRAAVIFYYWYDYSYDEIAASLSLSVSAIKSRLHRAKKEMASTWIENQSQPVLLERTRHESPAI